MKNKIKEAFYNSLIYRNIIYYKEMKIFKESIAKNKNSTHISNIDYSFMKSYMNNKNIFEETCSYLNHNNSTNTTNKLNNNNLLLSELENNIKNLQYNKARTTIDNILLKNTTKDTNTTTTNNNTNNLLHSLSLHKIKSYIHIENDEYLLSLKEAQEGLKLIELLLVKLNKEKSLENNFYSYILSLKLDFLLDLNLSLFFSSTTHTFNYLLEEILNVYSLSCNIQNSYLKFRSKTLYLYMNHVVGNRRKSVILSRYILNEYYNSFNLFQNSNLLFNIFCINLPNAEDFLYETYVCKSILKKYNNIIKIDVNNKDNNIAYLNKYMTIFKATKYAMKITNIENNIKKISNIIVGNNSNNSSNSSNPGNPSKSNTNKPIIDNYKSLHSDALISQYILYNITSRYLYNDNILENAIKENTLYFSNDSFSNIFLYNKLTFVYMRFSDFQNCEKLNKKYFNEIKRKLGDKTANKNNSSNNSSNIFIIINSYVESVISKSNNNISISKKKYSNTKSLIDVYFEGYKGEPEMLIDLKQFFDDSKLSKVYYISK